MFKHANKPLIITTLLMLSAVVIPIILIPQEMVSLIGALFHFITTDLAWFFLLIGFAMAVGAIILLSTKYGDIRLGGKDAKPHYKTFTWVSMNLCAALAAGILIFGMCEWMYYVNGTPFGITPKSTKAYEYASSYGFFHWGFSAWAFYLLPGICIGYLYWNKKIGTLRISTLCANTIGGDSLSHKTLRWFIDAILVFCYFMALMTTIGIGTPVIGELASNLLGVSNSFGMKVGILLIFSLFFTLSTSKSIAKGMGRISDLNVWLALAFFLFVLFSGDTSFILNNIVMSIGLNIREFIHMSFNTDAIAQTGFVQGWTIFYWAWYVALTFMCGIWIARTSYGRTFREIAICNCVWAVLACWITFGILGNYGLGQELFHGLDLSGQINSIGNNGATLLVLQSLPLPKLAILVFMLLIFFNLATTATANGTALSMYTSIGLKADEEPTPWYKTFWCILFLVIPLSLILLEHNIPGLNILKTIQSMITISALPVLIALVILFRSAYKAFKQDFADGTILESIDENKRYKWQNNRSSYETDI